MPTSASLLLLLVPPVLLINGGSSAAAVLLSQAASSARNAKDVANIAKEITVRIEGATQGSGVLVQRKGNLYTVLTAWHVVSGQRPGEELDVFTADGRRHSVVEGSIKRVGKVDMAELIFKSSDLRSESSELRSESPELRSEIC